MNGIKERRRYIPCRKRDIIDLLKTEIDDKDSFSRFSVILESILHFQFHKDLETLKDVYYPINPDLTSVVKNDSNSINLANRILMETLRKVLDKANYDPVTSDQIKAAYENAAALGFSLEIDMDDYDFLEVYARGRRKDLITSKKWFGLKRVESEHIILERVLMAVRMKEGAKSEIPEGKTIIKLFKDVPLEDLEILFPNSKVVMSLKDKLMLAVPAIAGGVPLLISKVVPALIVIFAVLGAYLGYRGTVEEDHLKQAVAALSAMGALGGYIIKQFSKYKTRKFQFQKELSDNLYFRNLVNNAGVFHSLIDAAEEEEVKEALLAYTFLSRSDKPLSETELDFSIEQWLGDKLNSEIDFECPDALSKLEKLGLLFKDQHGGLSVISFEEALIRLDYQWDNYFKYNQ
ncbi:MAG: DUF3754 domain-containing protein [Spirochaetales bacterium]|nr:DUF3754 domain-containing protein [Spirochaetales bacterium]